MGKHIYHTIYIFSLTSKLLKRIDILPIHSLSHSHSASCLHHNYEVAPRRAIFSVVSQWSNKVPFLNLSWCIHSFHHPSLFATASLTSNTLYYSDSLATCQIIHLPIRLIFPTSLTLEMQAFPKVLFLPVFCHLPAHSFSLSSHPFHSFKHHLLTNSSKIFTQILTLSQSPVLSIQLLAEPFHLWICCYLKNSTPKTQFIILLQGFQIMVSRSLRFMKMA